MNKACYSKMIAYCDKGHKNLLVLIISVIMSFAICGNVFAREFNQSTLAKDNVNIDSIHTINISKDITSIEDGIFVQFKNLERINVDTANPNYASYDGCLYSKDFKTLICIPQGRKSVYVKTCITDIAPHALDGLSQERIDKVYKLISNKSSSSAPASNGSKSKITYNYNNPSKGSAGNAGREVVNSNNNHGYVVNKDDYGNTDMSKYVVTYAGHKYFMYTGSGVKDLYVPEGVEVIYQLSPMGKVNTDIETIHLPSTMGSFGFSSWFFNLGDRNQYSTLHQCINLKNVTGGSDTVRATGSSVYINNKYGGQTLIWQRGSKVKYNRSAFY